MVILLTPSKPAQGRACGTCTLCCKAIPVAAIQKPRDRWCPHCVKGKGCGIYPDRPEECKRWSCLYLLDAEMPADMLPRHTHVVFDPVVCPVGVDGKERRAIQLWPDNGYPDAWKAPAVMRQVARYGAEFGVLALVRLGYNAVIIWPPALSKSGRFEHQHVVLDAPETWDEEEEWQVRDFWRRQGKS